MLHVTNGDFAVHVLQQAVQGEFLPWRDVLHEGPVREGLDLHALSRERAAFIAQRGWSSLSKVQEQFQERDAALAGEHEEVVLWFEHDLYDQLQLIQLLDWFASHPHRRLSLVCEAEYLGHMKPSRAAQLFVERKLVERRHLDEAVRAWAAFRAADPSGIEQVRPKALRFLGAALHRHLEEFPWTTDQLSRTERAILAAVPGDFKGIFAATREDPVFLGDTVLAWHLARMKEEGLLDERAGEWLATGRPRTKRVPRWLGGVRVDEGSPWRWDPARGEIRRLR